MGGCPPPETTRRWSLSTPCSKRTSSIAAAGDPDELAYEITYWIEHTYNDAAASEDLAD